mgnify:CR=1 FL=1
MGKKVSKRKKIVRSVELNHANLGTKLRTDFNALIAHISQTCRTTKFILMAESLDSEGKPFHIVLSDGKKYRMPTDYVGMCVAYVNRTVGKSEKL